MLGCCKLVVERVELGTNTNRCKYLINGSIDFSSLKHDFTTSFGDGSGEDVEGG